MSPHTIASYQVSLKILLRNGKNVLILNSDTEKSIDLPGGRINDVEHETPLEEIVAREVREELGEDVRYTLGKPIMQFRRKFRKTDQWVFLTVYEAEYLSGEIRLSDEHDTFRWIPVCELDLREKQFFSKEEWMAFKKYFSEKV